MKGYLYNHKRVYRIYRELELNLRIKPKRRLKRDKPDELAVQRQVSVTWPMDFMHDRLNDGRSFRTFNVIDDYVREGLNQHLFESIAHAQETAAQWLWHHNNEWFNMALGGITPSQKLTIAA